MTRLSFSKRRAAFAFAAVAATSYLLTYLVVGLFYRLL